MLSIRARVDMGAMAMKRHSTFPNVPALQGPYYRIVAVIYRIHLGGGLTPQWRSSLGILQPRQLSHRTLVGGAYPFVEKQSVYSPVPAEWATGQSLVGSYPFVEKQSVYSTAQADWAEFFFGKKLFGFE